MDRLALIIFICAIPACATKSGQEQIGPASTSLWNVVSIYDSNANAHIDPHEFNQFRNDPQVRKLFPGKTHLTFNDLDENNDDKISEAELNSAVHSQ